MVTNNWFDCESPRLVLNKYTKEYVQVGCGKCAACRARKISKNVPLLIREASCWKHVIFFTLTYNDKYLPKINIDDYETLPQFKQSLELCINKSKSFIDLHKRCIPVASSEHIQKFIKKIRQQIFRSFGERLAFRYFISSDFGSTLFRPHYHGIFFFQDDRIRDGLESLISQAWSYYNPSSKRSESFGRFEFEPARGAANYVSVYVNSTLDLPAIYSHHDFRPKSWHSSAPSLGSLIRSQESLEEIVRRGQTDITIYNPKTFTWDIQPLSSSLLRRLFPTIPSFSTLVRDERLRIYRRFVDEIGNDAEERRMNLKHCLVVNSFFRNYITLNQRFLTEEQITDKLDRVFYTVSRLFHQSQMYGVSLADYDDFIVKYANNKFHELIKKQFAYENQNAHLPLNVLLSRIDVAYPDNKRSVPSFVRNDFKSPCPESCEPVFFRNAKKRYNKMIKRKCDNAYLERHPEFKQFHS